MSQLERNFGALSMGDRQSIELEHVRLARFMSDLRATCSEFSSSADCQDCAKEKVASCQGQLPSFFYDYLDLLEEHFDNEERILLGVIKTQDERVHLRLHHDEHMRLLRQVKQLIQEASTMSRQGNVAAAIFQFYQQITDIFSEHDRAFDATFMRIVDSQ